MRFEITCNADDYGEIIWTRADDSSDCDIKYSSSNYAGCYIDASVYFKWVNAFSGFIMIGIGAFLVFVGANFIKWVCGIFVFFFVQAMVFALAYSYSLVDPVSLFRSQEVDGQTGVIAILVLIIAILIGVMAAYYFTQHVSKLFLLILAFQNGCLIGFMLLSLLPFQLKPMFVFAFGGVVGVALAYYSYKKLKYVKTIGTACFGAFLLTKGVGSFVGQFPALFDNIQ